MKWKKASEYAILSQCGQYSVAKYGSPEGFTYGAWRTLSHPSGRLLLAANLSDASTAKARCEHDSVQFQRGKTAKRESAGTAWSDIHGG